MGNRASTNSTSPDCQYASMKQVAAYFGVSVTLIREWIAADGFPKPYRFGPQTARFRWSEVLEWEASLPKYDFEQAG